MAALARAVEQDKINHTIIPFEIGLFWHAFSEKVKQQFCLSCAQPKISLGQALVFFLWKKHQTVSATKGWWKYCFSQLQMPAYVLL